MAKKKSSSAAEAALPPAAYSPAEPWWPAEFAPFRFALMQGVFLLLLGAILYVAAITNGLIPLKELLAWAIGSFDPLHLPEANSRDLASLIWCFFFVAGNALIHPSLGLISLATLRPWLDGYTFKNDNVYFLWGAVLLLALWGVRALMRNEPLRFPLLTALSSAYLLFALALCPWSVNFGETYKQLLLWTSYVAVFAVTLQNLTTRRTQLFVLWAVLLGMGFQAIFAVLQYHYVLPFLRHLINQDPSVLKRFFGVDRVTPEMQHRFNKNRAFGTVLFPNALAALLILGIPGCAVLLRNMVAEMLPVWRLRARLTPQVTAAYRRRAIAVAAVVWFVAMILFFSLTIIPTSYDPSSTSAGYSPPWYFNIYFLFGSACVLALIPAALYFLFAVRHGFPFANQAVLLVSTAITLWWLVWALWLSFSRGGMLALLVGCAAGIVLYAAPARPTAFLRRWLPHAAALVLIVALAGVAFSTLEHSAQAQAPGGSVTRAGENVSASDLASTESFSLRLSYWRVGLRMFLDNAFIGVGLGSFKWAYPLYQHVGDGNVQEAHNSYLQAFAETGIVGGLLLLAFWVWLLAWCAARILAEEDRSRRRLLAAMMAGLVAFLLHAAVDINFAHPTLMFFCMLFAAMLCVFAADATPPVASRSRIPIIAGLLIGATFATGLSTRPWLQNLSLARMQFIGGDSEDEMMKRFRIADYVLVGAPQALVDHAPAKPVPIRGLDYFALDLKPYFDQSRSYVPKNDGSGMLTAAPAGTKLSEVSHFVIQDQWVVADQFKRDVRPWIESMIAEDARFPHDVQVAMHISNWHQLLTYWPSNATPEDIAAAREWSDETIARNPLNADCYINKSRTVIQEWGAHKDNLDLLKEAVALREKACELAPAQYIFRYLLADNLKMLADALQKAGDAEGERATREREAATRTTAWQILSHDMPESDQKNPPPGMSGVTEVRP